MPSEYLAILVFIIFSLLFPASLILFSKLVRRYPNQNEVTRQNYESSEQSIGSRLTIMKEYFHYFSSFLAFEIIAAVVLVWALASKSLTFQTNIAVITFVGTGFMLEIFAVILAIQRE